LGIKYVAFYALVMILKNKFSQIAPLEGAVPVRINYRNIDANFHQIYRKFSPNSTKKVHLLHH
jgi:hypothetical protein